MAARRLASSDMPADASLTRLQGLQRHTAAPYLVLSGKVRYPWTIWRLAAQANCKALALGSVSLQSSAAPVSVVTHSSSNPAGHFIVVCLPAM